MTESIEALVKQGWRIVSTSPVTRFEASNDYCRLDKAVRTIPAVKQSETSFVCCDFCDEPLNWRDLSTVRACVECEYRYNACIDCCGIDCGVCPPSFDLTPCGLKRK